MQSIGRIWDGLVTKEGTLESYVGTYAALGIDKGGIIWLPCDISIDTWTTTKPTMFRAHRLWKKIRGRKVKKLKDEHLSEEAIFIFGPEVSPERAIDFLERMIVEIKKRGLYIGKVDGGDDYFREKLAGKIIDEQEREINLVKYQPQ